MVSHYDLVDSVRVYEETEGRIPHLAGVEDKVGGVVGNLGTCFGRVYFILVFPLIPDYFYFVINS